MVFVVLMLVGDKKELTGNTFCFEHCDNKKDKKVVAQKIFAIFMLSLQFSYRFKRQKIYIKGYERKDKDIKEKIKKTNIKLKDKVNFIAFHNDNRLQNVFFAQICISFLLSFICLLSLSFNRFNPYHKYLFWTVGRNEKLNLNDKK